MYNKIGDKVKVIFLDVYGVLIHNNYRNPKNLHIDEEKVKILKQIVDKTNAKIVLSSTWKNSYNKKIIPNRYNVLEKILEKYNLKIYDRVPSLKPELLTKEKLQDKKYKKVTSKYDPNTRRSAEINKYLRGSLVDSEGNVHIMTDWGDEFTLKPNEVIERYGMDVDSLQKKLDDMSKDIEGTITVPLKKDTLLTRGQSEEFLRNLYDIFLVRGRNRCYSVSVLIPFIQLRGGIGTLLFFYRNRNVTAGAAGSNIETGGFL